MKARYFVLFAAQKTIKLNLNNFKTKIHILRLHDHFFFTNVFVLLIHYSLHA